MSREISGPDAPSAHPLEILLRPLFPAEVTEIDVRDRDTAPYEGVVCLAADGPPEWLTGTHWRALAAAAEVESAGELVDTIRRADGPPLHVVSLDRATVLPFSLSSAYTAYVAERWRDQTAQRRLSERQLAWFYRVRRLIPRRAQLAARRALIRAQGTPAFPTWPLDSSVGGLLRLFAQCALRAAGREEGEFVWFWPDGLRSSLILTHDVETAEGIRLALELADIEEELGFRSSFNFGAWYDIDPGVLRELDDRGFEVGMHGLTHDRQLFSSRPAFEARLPDLGALARTLGAVGFRSPATHRVFDWLGELPVEYDCTIPNSDPYEPQPGGCCSVWPFFVGPVVELPYTLTQDHTMLTLLGERTPDRWLDQATAVQQEYGLVQCVSHPDRDYLAERDKRAVYRAFVSAIADPEHIWHALPREVARWWRLRSSAPGDDRFAHGRVRLGDEGSAVLEPPA